jgi:hypothetical protein
VAALTIHPIGENCRFSHMPSRLPMVLEIDQVSADGINHHRSEMPPVGSARLTGLLRHTV